MAHEVDVEARREDGGRDALALLAACLSDDYEGQGVILNNCDGVALVSALCSIVLNLLKDRGTDPAAWVARVQVRPDDWQSSP